MVTQPHFSGGGGNRVIQRPHEKCVSVTNLDDPCLVVGFTCGMSPNMVKLLLPKVLQIIFPAAIPEGSVLQGQRLELGIFPKEEFWSPPNPWSTRTLTLDKYGRVAAAH